MPRLATANSRHIDEIYEESRALWGAGLAPEDYRGLWDEIEATPWAREHLRYRVWLSRPGRLLSSVKHYRCNARLLGNPVVVDGFGALFTPGAERGRGHATDMMRTILEECRARGDDLALLFTDIGSRFYRRLGFWEFPAEEAWGRLPRRIHESGISLRPMSPHDLAEICRLQRSVPPARALRLERDDHAWHYLWTRSSAFFRRLDGSDLEHRFRVATRDGVPVGYVISVDARDVWVVREIVAAGGEGELLGAVLRAAAAEARERGLRRVHGWLPRSFTTLVPEWGLEFRRRRQARPMIADLRRDGSPPLSTGEPVFLSYLDQF